MTGSVLLHLMRHGAPERPGRMLGRTDDAPTPEGVAACLARAAGLAFGQVVSSDLRRAEDPARVIAAGHHVPHRVDAGWRELDFGDWDGLLPGEIEADALARFYADPDASPPPGGERWSALAARVGDALAALGPEPVLVVTHGGAMRAALHHLCGFGQAQLWAFDLPYGAVLSLRIWPGAAAQVTGLAA